MSVRSRLGSVVKRAAVAAKNITGASRTVAAARAPLARISPFGAAAGATVAVGKSRLPSIGKFALGGPAALAIGAFNRKPASVQSKTTARGTSMGLGGRVKQFLGSTGGKVAVGAVAGLAAGFIAQGLSKATAHKMARKQLGVRHSPRGAFVSKRAMKIIRRSHAIKKQVARAARMLGLKVSTSGRRTGNSKGVITAAEALKALRS